MRRHHLVILKQPYIDAVLAGGKTVESRFGVTRHQPFGAISSDDIMFLKQSCGPVRAKCRAARVLQYNDLTPAKISSIRRRYGRQIGGDDSYWQQRADCRYGTLIWLDSVTAIEPVRIDKRDRRAWVVLSGDRNFGLL